MTVLEQLAYRLVAVGAEIMAVAARLRHSGEFAGTTGFLAFTQDRLALLAGAAAALEAGDETECRLILDHLTAQRPPEFGEDRPP